MNTSTIGYVFTDDGRIDQDRIVILIWTLDLFFPVFAVLLWKVHNKLESNCRDVFIEYIHHMKALLTWKSILINAALFLFLLFLVEVFFPSRRLKITTHHIEESKSKIYHNGIARHEIVEATATDITGYRREKFQYHVWTDQHGARVDAYPRAYTRSRNLVLVGDSYMFGQHAEYRNSLAGWLEEALDNYNIYNFGVNGSSSFSYDKIIQYFLRKKELQPDHLVVGIMLNLNVGDLPRVMARRTYGAQVYYQGHKMSQAQANQLQKSAWERLLFFANLTMRRYSTIFNILFPRVVSQKFAIQIPPDDAREKFAQYSSLLLENMNRIASQSNVKKEDIIVLYVIHSEEIRMDAEMRKSALAREEAPNDQSVTKSFWNRFKKRLQSEGYVVVDPWDALAEMSENGVLTHATDGHMVSAGYRVLAREVARRIQQLDAP